MITTKQQAADAVTATLGERGWCQGVTLDTAGRVCLDGAFLFTGLACTYAGRALKNAIICDIAENYPARGPLIWTFNDDPATTYEDVILVVKRAGASEDSPGE